jgi:hypothetical protein
MATKSTSRCCTSNSATSGVAPSSTLNIGPADRQRRAVRQI